MTSISGPDISPDFTERQCADFGPQRLAYSAQINEATQTTPGVIFCGGSDLIWAAPGAGTGILGN